MGQALEERKVVLANIGRCEAAQISELFYSAVDLKLI